MHYNEILKNARFNNNHEKLLLHLEQNLMFPFSIPSCLPNKHATLYMYSV